MTSGRPLLVGIDVGTTRIKAGVIGLDGVELGRAAVPTLWQRRPTGVDARPGDFLDAVQQALATILATAPVGPVVAVGITSMAETAVLIGPDGSAVGPAVAWYDRRAESDFSAMSAEFTRAEIGHQTGLTAALVPTVAVLRRLMRDHPDLRSAVKTLSVAEFIAYSLGGTLASEPSLASRTGALSITSGQWWPEVVDWADLPPGLFADLQPAGSSWGTVRHMGPGLERLVGATVTVAGHDHLVAAVGSGVCGSDQVMNSCGTAEGLVRAVPADPARDPADGLSGGISTGRHVLADRYCLLAGLPLGIELTPLLQELGAEHRAGHTSLDDAVLQSLDGRLAEEDLSAAARRWLDGVRSATGRASVALGELERLGGPISEVRLSGGWATNPVLRRLKEAEFARTVYPAVAEAGVRGAGLLAGMAAGLFDSVDGFPAAAIAPESPAAVDPSLVVAESLPLSISPSEVPLI